MTSKPCGHYGHYWLKGIERGKELKHSVSPNFEVLNRLAFKESRQLTEVLEGEDLEVARSRYANGIVTAILQNL